MATKQLSDYVGGQGVAPSAKIIAYGTDVTPDLELTLNTFEEGTFVSLDFLSSVAAPIAAEFSINDDRELMANAE